MSFLLSFQTLTPHFPHRADGFPPQRENNSHQSGTLSTSSHHTDKCTDIHVDDFHFPFCLHLRQILLLCFGFQFLLHPQKLSFIHYLFSIIFLFIKSFPQEFKWNQYFPLLNMAPSAPFLLCSATSIPPPHSEPHFLK